MSIALAVSSSDKVMHKNVKNFKLIFCRVEKIDRLGSYLIEILFKFSVRMIWCQIYLCETEVQWLTALEEEYPQFLQDFASDVFYQTSVRIN